MSESDPSFRMPCSCESAECRGTVTGDDWQMPELRRRYRGLFSPYLQQKIDLEEKMLPINADVD